MKETMNQIASIEEIYSSYAKTYTASTDTRNCPEGCLFIALKGERFDANTMAEDALKNGASAVVVDNPNYYKPDGAHFLVSNTLETLQRLAQYHRRQMGLPILAITGTNGKTTTKELVSAVLKRGYRILSTQGNLNNHIGVPITLLRLRPHHQLAVIEMGASKPGDIKELVEIAEPNYGLITNIGCAHLEGFGSYEGVKATKGELYDYLKENAGTVFYNYDDPVLAEMSKEITRVGYGTSKVAAVHGRVIAANPPYFCFRWKQNFVYHDVRTKLIGDYNLNNALAAVAIGRFFDVATQSIQDGLTDYTPQNSRSQLVKKSSLSIIVDAYNANPSSMKEAIDNFVKIPTGNPKVLLLGDMNELGENSLQLHKELIEHLQQQPKFDRIIMVGPILSQVVNELRASSRFTLFIDTVLNIEEAKHLIEKMPIPENSFLLVKGSNSLHLDRILEYL